MSTARSETDGPRIRTFTCNACHDTACECSTEGDIPPTHCCMNLIPAWKGAGE